MKRSSIVLIAIALLAVTACSIEETLPAPGCSGGSGLISAQSVPSAELLPCFLSLPDGWSHASVKINQDGTTVHLDSDRAGEGAATMSFDATCDIGDAVSVPSTLDGAAQFDSIERLQGGYRAETFYVFEGGCVHWEFDFDKDASATDSIGLRDSLLLLSRKDLNDSLRESFIDEEL